MTLTPTERYIAALAVLKSGELGLLRTHAGQPLDESVAGFDLFAGIWWPLREQNQRAPRREVAWLVAKLYAFRALKDEPGALLARQLRRCRPGEDGKARGFTARFDRLLNVPLGRLEPSLRWTLDALAAQKLPVDWTRLTDDLSIWQREKTRLSWAEQFVESDERGEKC